MLPIPWALPDLWASPLTANRANRKTTEKNLSIIERAALITPSLLRDNRGGGSLLVQPLHPGPYRREGQHGQPLQVRQWQPRAWGCGGRRYSPGISWNQHVTDRECLSAGEPGPARVHPGTVWGANIPGVPGAARRADRDRDRSHSIRLSPSVHHAQVRWGGRNTITQNSLSNRHILCYLYTFYQNPLTGQFSHLTLP